jgi:cellulose synthase/poly-beta-1,6-N-acetylglucosamine synthase-like glycosyltransferase
MTDANWIALLVFFIALLFALVLENWRSFIVSASRITDRQKGLRKDGVTVLIPARNAADSIGALLQDLYGQDIPASNVEVIVIDDHSSDGTVGIVKGMMRSWLQLKVILSAREGKKAAITKGVEEASFDLILITDADVRCGPARLSTILDHWKEHDPHLLVMPVATARSKSFLGELQRHEQIALQAVALGSASAGRPMLASGANMAFSRSAFISVGGYSGDRWASGDDMFLLRRMQRTRKKIDVLADPSVAVIVQPESDLRSAFQQRLRWAGKMRAYWDPIGSLMTLIALMVPFVIAWGTVAVADRIEFGERSFMSALLIISAWCLWLFPIIRLVQAMDRSFADIQHPGMQPVSGGVSWLSTIGALIAFSIYAPIIFLLSIFVRPLWKGRRV